MQPMTYPLLHSKKAVADKIANTQLLYLACPSQKWHHNPNKQTKKGADAQQHYIQVDSVDPQVAWEYVIKVK